MIEFEPRPETPATKRLVRSCTTTARVLSFVLGSVLGMGLSVTTGSPAAAQYINRGPTINVGPRMPNINLNGSVHYSPQVRYGEKDNVRRPPSRRPPPRRHPTRIIVEDDFFDLPPSGPPPRRHFAKKTPPKAIAKSRYLPKEVVIEVDGKPGAAEVDALARRHRLSRIASQSFDITNSTMFRWRIRDNRSVEAVVRELRADGNVKSVQPNFRFLLQQGAAAAAEGPDQYAAVKLHLPQAHSLAKGDGVVVAIIDSGIDGNHPELAGSIVGSFDALKSDEKAHVHGTGIAGAIAAHARLEGAAPAVRLLAVRAFGKVGGSAESNSFSILRSLEYSVSHGARVINMSFAGPADPLLGRALAAVAAKGIVLVAAAGNAGPKSPPLYPAADPNVIAVSATDASDKIFNASNRGPYVVVAAPGVDLVLPAPGAKYQITSGTSFSAAYVSGLIALMIERNPGLTAADIRRVLEKTAHDLGPKGRDNDFGAGLADALAAVAAVAPAETEISAGTPAR